MPGASASRIIGAGIGGLTEIALHSRVGCARRVVAGAVWCMSLAASASVLAQSYPTRPIRLLVPDTPGAAPDLIIRLVVPGLESELGQPLIMEHRPGAGSSIAAAQLAKAPGDGYTLMYAITATFVVAPFVFQNPGYHPVDSFTFIGGVSSSPFVLVASASSGLTNLAGIVARSRAKPQSVTFGSGTGSLPHFAGFLLMQKAGIELTHVPYKSAAQVVPDLLAGRVDLHFDQLPSLRPHFESKKIAPILVASGTPHPQAPEIPTSVDANVPGFDVTAISGIIAPQGVAPDVVRRLSEALARTLGQTSVRESFRSRGIETMPLGPDQFRSLIARETVRWEPVIKGSGIRIQ